MKSTKRESSPDCSLAFLASFSSLANYCSLISCLQRLMLWISLASYSSRTYQEAEEEGMSVWSSDFRKYQLELTPPLQSNEEHLLGKIITNVNTTSNKITSLFSMLSSSLSNALPLPPYLEMPQPFQFLKKLNEIDRDILSIRHIAEPEYSAFAVMQVVSQSINADIVKLTE